MQTYFSHGKLLLTGEYVVLDGATALAVPTKYGQSLQVNSHHTPEIFWKSLDANHAVWFEHTFFIETPHSTPLVTTNSSHPVAQRLVNILNTAIQLNPDFIVNKGFEVTTALDFPKDWGLGTSSTLINNIAQWAKIDAYKLLDATFGGSGYDIACAQNQTPLTYMLEEKMPYVNTVDFNPDFKSHLYFVYLNKKQNSRDGIKHYNNNKRDLTPAISAINTITSQLISCKTLGDFETLVNQHESIISKLIKVTPVKTRLFEDFNGTVKSLGAWGGDFVLVSSKTDPRAYFEAKGYDTVIPYVNMV